MGNRRGADGTRDLTIETSLTRRHHNGAIGKGNRTVELVTREDDRSSLVGGTAHEAIEQVAAGGVKARMGFVEQPQGTVTGQQDSQRRPTSLTCRQPRDRDGGESSVQTDTCQGAIGRRLRTACCTSPERDVVGHAQVLVQTRCVTEQADQRTNGSAIGTKIAAQHHGLTLGHGDEAGQRPQQGRLACPVGTAKQHHLTSVDLEVDTGKSGKAAQEADRGTKVDDGLHG